jgi:hypothetical protein
LVQRLDGVVTESCNEHRLKSNVCDFIQHVETVAIGHLDIQEDNIGLMLIDCV